MNITVRIRPIKPLIGESSQLLGGEYKDSITGESVKILNNDKVVLNRNLNNGEKVKMISFQNRIQPHYDITYNDEVKGSDYLIKVWARHPSIQCKGNTNLVNPQFVMENLKELLSDERMAIKKKGMVFNLINNTTVEDMRNIAFSVGLNPIKMNDDEIFIKLIKFEDGKLMANPDEFLKNYNAPDYQIQIIVRKALLLEVITQQHGKYYIKDEIIGSSFDDLVIYCKKNPNMYENFIRKEVAKKDDLLPSGADSVKNLGGDEGEKEIEEKKKELIRKAKQVGVEPRGLQNMSIPNLEKKIAQAEREHVKAPVGDETPKIETNMMSEAEKESIDNAITQATGGGQTNIGKI